MTKRKTVDVAAGVILRADGAFLLGQRAEGTFYSGYWEFPGGKVEAGESPGAALIRELDEELGIRVERLYPWLVREHDYEHAHVRLHFFQVDQWSGEPQPHVHRLLSWERVERRGGAINLARAPMLPANGPVLKALALPNEMGITHASVIGIDPQLAALDRALSRGLRLIQVREDALPLAARRDFASEVVRRAHAVGALVIINAANHGEGGDAFAHAVGADGLHLPAARLMASAARPDFVWAGASCHHRAELEQAARLGLDYALLGAVNPTPTHPAGEPLGWSRFAERAQNLPLPIFALGGVGAADRARARQAGAHGIAAIRGAWEAD